MSPGTEIKRWNSTQTFERFELYSRYVLHNSFSYQLIARSLFKKHFISEWWLNSQKLLLSFCVNNIVNKSRVRNQTLVCPIAHVSSWHYMVIKPGTYPTTLFPMLFYMLSVTVVYHWDFHRGHRYKCSPFLNYFFRFLERHLQFNCSFLLHCSFYFLFVERNHLPVMNADKHFKRKWNEKFLGKICFHSDEKPFSANKFFCNNIFGN